MGLRVASLNVWGLPWGLARDLPARLDAIGRRLPGLDVDVVAFQEVWTSHGLETLRAAGRRAGLTHAWSGGLGVAGGGLLVLSRLPVLRGRFERYATCGLPERIWNGDYLAGKGFAELEIAAPGGNVAVFATHLVSQYAPDPEDVYRGQRMAQVVQLAQRVRRQVLPVVALGDFNLRDDQPHYTALLGLAGLRDAARERSRRQATVTASNPYRRERRSRRDARIDYVFVRNGLGSGLRVSQIDRVFDEPLEDAGALTYSDHAGLRAELEPGPGAPPARVDLAAVETARHVLLRARVAAEQRRHDRRLAGTGAGAAALVCLGAHRGGLSRRRLLRGLLVSGGVLAGLAGIGAAGLVVLASPDESQGIDTALRQLDALAARA